MTALDFYKERLRDRGFSEKQIKDLTDHKDLPLLQFAEDYLDKQLILSGVSKRYDVSKYTPPFRVGRKQGKAVLDGTGREVIFFSDSEEQAKMYCDYLNNVC